MTKFVAVATLGLASCVSAFVAPSAGVPAKVAQPATAAPVADVVSAEGLEVRNPPGDIALDQEVYRRYMNLPQPKTMVQAEYIWIGGSGSDIRCKTRTLKKAETDPSKLPLWNYDGSSTGQAPGDDSEVLLRPCKVYPDPIRGGDNILVMCDALTPDMEPIPTNTRAPAAAAFSKISGEDPWFGIEQEYTLFHKDGKTPFGWPTDGSEPGPQGPYYCSIGTENAYGRYIAEAHYKACMYANIPISGINGEVMPAQWEYQVGPAVGMDAGDDMWMSRYLLDRVCEDFGVIASLDPKPIPGYNGAGAHTNFSTKKMRAPGGYDTIIDAVEKLGKRHVEHINSYGEGNERRLTGGYETASINEFKYGVADRGASIRIPRTTEADKCGYFEDRRPSSNMDPYVVTGMIMDTCCVWDGKE